MRLVEYLIFVLEAHAQTLQRLAAFFGEEAFLEILESADESIPHRTTLQPPVKEAWNAPSPHEIASYAYGELEGAVLEFNLPAVLQFHLWAYPYYRKFIESDLDLNAKIQGTGSNVGLELVGEAVAEAEAWVRALPIPPAVGPQAERAAQVPWLRFRTNVLKRIGKRPLGPVY